ncbi:PAS domain S-box [Halogeometricum borinquense DSM 11551]|uniref:PAS domain S-box n=1 Tax=Halogeometricum borinquense (strain ATCC 700274 / DSM 11551 / JCM 10706 / KCTC 4070 / PR3) TaxID=469382 RepID=E4NWR3_HALBP|nr:bacterio-opsin activator domain-containing protein [Halogeometricum borinquense]ADQ69483.1 PAS domain S-box [Halogeometricum borinquense DSM 11551]ELY26196.1 PAS domain S-box [Halogeometricum borinquense DSM 11551]
MTAESATSQSAAVEVHLLGDGPHAADVREDLRCDDRISVQSSDEESASPVTEVDCIVCTSVDVVSATPDGQAPVVVVLSTADNDVISRAYSAGATSVLFSTEALSDRLAWVTGLSRASTDDSVTTTDVTDVAAGFNDAACVLDRQWRVVEATAAFCEFFGADPTLDGENLWATCPNTRTTADRCWRAVLTGDDAEFEVTFRDGRRVAVNAVPLRDGLALRYRDVSERTETERALDRYKRILETIDDGIYILDENFQIAAVNEAVLEMTGYDRETLVGEHATMLADESVIIEASAIIQRILTGELSDGRLDVELETADGSRLPVETRFSALRFNDGTHGTVGVIRDISDRRQYEQTLTALNSSAHELFNSQTKPAVGERVLNTATQILELESVVVFLYDESVGELRPVAWEGTGSPPSIGPGDGVLWTCFVECESVHLRTDEQTLDRWDRLEAVDSDASNGESVAIPLGEHGVLATSSSGENAPRNQSTLTHLLAANAEAALDRVTRSIELKRRRGELARRNEELMNLNRFNELLREVNRVLVEADSREEIERAVCERLVEGPAIAFAWVGAYDRVDEAIGSRAWAGAERGYLDCLSESPAEFRTEPSVVTTRTHETTVVDNVGQEIQAHQWRRDALDRGFASVASVPLTYNEFSYGTLTIYATEPNAFDKQMRLMFEELGVTTANAINGAEAKESLHTESFVELDVHITSQNEPLLRIAQALDATVQLEGSVQQTSGSALLYLTVSESDTTRNAEILSSLTVIEQVREIAARENETVVEVQLAAEALPSRLADFGAVARTLTARPDALTVVIELPSGSEIRKFVEYLREWYPGTELNAKRTRERSIETQQSFRARLRKSLTDRQFEALRTAYFSGYFAWPRERTASEIATSLDIAQPTFSRHLRVAEQKLFDNLLAD